MSMKGGEKGPENHLIFLERACPQKKNKKIVECRRFLLSLCILVIYLELMLSVFYVEAIYYAQKSSFVTFGFCNL